MHKLRKLAPGRASAVTALRERSGEVLTGPEGIGAELRRHWSFVFAKRQQVDVR